MVRRIWRRVKRWAMPKWYKEGMVSPPTVNPSVIEVLEKGEELLKGEEEESTDEAVEVGVEDDEE